ncbi:hypothetical protein IPL85_03685 [Candidatus Saccharibacteria bacterium]|nr:MAG: hypothetical protein IPL85_03685 [Candidatus Saccharibacteria bacterium]
MTKPPRHLRLFSSNGEKVSPKYPPEQAAAPLTRKQKLLRRLLPFALSAASATGAAIAVASRTTTAVVERGDSYTVTHDNRGKTCIEGQLTIGPGDLVSDAVVSALAKVGLSPTDANVNAATRDQVALYGSNGKPLNLMAGTPGEVTVTGICSIPGQGQRTLTLEPPNKQ